MYIKIGIQLNNFITKIQNKKHKTTFLNVKAAFFFILCKFHNRNIANASFYIAFRIKVAVCYSPKLASLLGHTETIPVDDLKWQIKPENHM